MNLTRAVKDKSGKTLRTTDEAKRFVLAKLKARPGYRFVEARRRSRSFQFLLRPPNAARAPLRKRVRTMTEPAR